MTKFRVRRSAGIAAVACGALVLVATGAPLAAAQDNPVGDVLAETGFAVRELVGASGAVPAGLGVLTYSAVLTFTPGGSTPTVTDVVVTQRPLDYNGAGTGTERVLTDTASVIAVPRGKAAAVDCNWQGPKRHGVETFAPQQIRVATEVGTLDIASAFAQAPKTTKYVGEAPRTQWVGCAAGGAKLADGFRVIQAGGGLAYKDAAKSWKLGMAWKSGAAPARYELASGFPVAYEKTGAMVGTVRQNKGGQLLGSFSAPVTTAADGLERNSSFAYWQDRCMDSPACAGAEGSRVFQGATASAAWALPGEGARSFVVAGYVHYACANLADAACS
ncbi:MAG: hypothetical protein ACT4QF_02470 [Sporichthyaceae bacterium]